MVRRSLADCSRLGICVKSLTCANGCASAYSAAKRRIPTRLPSLLLLRCNLHILTRVSQLQSQSPQRFSPSRGFCANLRSNPNPPTKSTPHRRRRNQHLRSRVRVGHPRPVSAVAPAAGVEAADDRAEAGNKPSLRHSPLQRSRDQSPQRRWKKRLLIVGKQLPRDQFRENLSGHKFLKPPRVLPRCPRPSAHLRAW